MRLFDDDRPQEDTKIKGRGVLTIVVITEIAEGARTPTERSSYVITNNYHGPVAGVAQGNNASVANLKQHVEATSPADLADAIARILNALPPGHDEDVDVLKSAQAEFRSNRIPPLMRLGQALRGLSKIEDLAIRAPEAVHGINSLGATLGLW